MSAERDPRTHVTTLQAVVQDPRALRLLTRNNNVFSAAAPSAARHWVDAIVSRTAFLPPLRRL